MNTANLQLEGLYAAVSALMGALREKDVLSQEEIDTCLARAEKLNASCRRTELPAANLEAILFPFRYLRAANAASEPKSFSEIATAIGMRKDDDIRPS